MFGLPPSPDLLQVEGPVSANFDLNCRKPLHDLTETQCTANRGLPHTVFGKFLLPYPELRAGSSLHRLCPWVSGPSASIAVCSLLGGVLCEVRALLEDFSVQSALEIS